MANGDIWLWSTTAADNDDADADIEWREGQLPGTVNGSARTMMSALASYRGGVISDKRKAITTAYSVVASDGGKTIAAGGAAFYTITLGAASEFATEFAVRIHNEDAVRGKRVSPNGLTSFILYPGQTVIIYKQNNAWKRDPQYQRWAAPGGTPTFHVHPTLGDDSNDGLAAGAGSAFATVQAAVNAVQNNVDHNGSAVVIQLADGTYTAGATITAAPIGYTVTCTFQGNASTPSNVFVNVAGLAFNVQDHAVVSINNMRIGATSVCVAARQFAIVDLNNVEFHTTGSTHIAASDGSVISMVGNYAITGDALIHASASGSSLVNLGVTCTIGSTRTFDTFAVTSQFGQIAGTTTFAGPGVAGTTGRRFSTTNGLVDTATTYPGSLPGIGTIQATADGTAGAPFYTWANDPDTGFYRVGANNPGMSAGSIKIQTWKTSGTDIIGVLDLSAATSGQIQFPASQNASANANTLDDYEEGTFTPAITFATPGDLSVAYLFQVGTYTKIGNRVIATVNIVTSSFTFTTASGALSITGLPYTSDVTNNNQHVGAVIWQGITRAGIAGIAARVVNSSTTISLVASASGSAVAVIAASDMPSGGSIVLRMTLAYQAAN